MRSRFRIPRIHQNPLHRRGRESEGQELVDPEGIATIFDTTWNFGEVGPDFVRKGSGEHLIAHWHFTIEVPWAAFTGETMVPFEDNFAPGLDLPKWRSREARQGMWRGGPTQMGPARPLRVDSHETMGRHKPMVDNVQMQLTCSRVATGVVLLAACLSVLVMCVGYRSSAAAGERRTAQCIVPETRERIFLHDSGLRCSEARAILYVLPAVGGMHKVNSPNGTWLCFDFGKSKLPLAVRCHQGQKFFTIQAS